MAGINAAQSGTASRSNCFKEAVCVETARIFDSCSDKDCLEDLQCFFSDRGQAVIDESALIKCMSAELVDTYFSVEAVPFNNGYYAADITYYFRTQFSCRTSPVATPINVRGLAVHTKKAVLYGGDGGVKTFSSNGVSESEPVPVVCLKAVDPIVLASRSVDGVPAFSEPLGRVPEPVARMFDDVLITQPDNTAKTILVTLGLFSIITLQRPVQLMIPSYDYVLPEKDCAMPVTADDPCEMFKRIQFPVDEFFPDNVNDVHDRI